MFNRITVSVLLKSVIVTLALVVVAVSCLERVELLEAARFGKTHRHRH